jgi:hypothetical protein
LNPAVERRKLPLLAVSARWPVPNGPDDDDEGFPTSAEISRMDPQTGAEPPMSHRPGFWPVAVAVGVVLIVAIIIVYYLAR